MKKLPHLLLACGLVLASACPALAELSVTIINRSDMEIQTVKMSSDGGSMQFGAQVVPGNHCVFGDSNASTLQEITIDAGLELYTFTEMGELAGNSTPALEFTLDADHRPHLTLVDGPEGTGSHPGSLQIGESFDLEAGPIWDNAHAGTRCPEVLEKWLAANPGKEAEWNGNWATVKPGEMSVCGIRLTGGADTPSASASLINVVGKLQTVFADPAVSASTDFATLVAAKTMKDIEKMGAQTSPLWDSQMYIPVAFAGKTWAAFVESDEDFGSSKPARPGICHLRTYNGGEDGLQEFMIALAEADYRPWYAQVTIGEDMDTEEMVNFHSEEIDREEAWEQVTNTSWYIFDEGDPAALDVILLSNKDYDRAADDGEGAMPGFRLRVSNAALITMQYWPDIAELVSMTR